MKPIDWNTWRTRVLATVASLAILGGCGERGPAKIQLASEAGASDQVQGAARVLRVDEGQRHAVAIARFANDTRRPELDWLRHGLADGLERELSRSTSFAVLQAGRLRALLDRDRRSGDDWADLAAIRHAAREAGVTSIITGRYFEDGGELVVDTQIRDVETGEARPLNEVRGAGVESVLAMVGQVSGRVQESFGEQPPEGSPRAATASVEAYALYSRGRAEVDKFLIAEADAQFAKAIELDPDFAAAYLQRARTRYNLGDESGSLEMLAAARRTAERLSVPEELSLRLREAQAEDDVEALRAIRDELARRAPNDVEARWEVAQLLFGSKEYERALGELEELIEVDPRRALPYNQLGYIHAFRGDFPSAHKYLETYRDLTPGEPNAHDSIGEVLMMEGRFEEAVERFERALARWPEFTNSVARLTEAHAELGDFDQALRYADRWNEIAPEGKRRAEARAARAVVLWRAGELDRALAELDEARAAAPDDATLVYLTSALHRAAGRPSDAARVVREFFDAHRTPAARRGWSDAQTVKLVWLGLEAGLDPVALLAAVESVEDGSQPGALGDQFRLYRGVAMLRAGRTSAASGCLVGPHGGGLTDLVGARYVGRGSTWKYVVEAIQLEPKNDPEACSIASKVLAATRRSERKDIEVLGRLLVAQHAAKHGKSADLAASWRQLGVAGEDEWRVIGPYPSKSGFRAAFGPELALAVRADGRVRPADTQAWQRPQDGLPDGFVDLGETLGEAPWSVGYAAVRIQSPDERVVQLRIGATESVKVWVNDDLVWKIYRNHEVPIDHDIVQVMLRPGDNRVLIKLVNRFGDWGFYFRATDGSGEGFADLKFRAPGPELASLAGHGG